jgi:hypothetical protein
MKISEQLAGVMVCLGLTGTASAQSVTEIVDKHLAALGGRQVLETLTSRTISGTVTLTSPVGDLSGTIQVFSQAPNRERTLITLDLAALGAGQMTFEQRFDGTTGFVMDSLQGNREITGAQLENMKNLAFPSAFLNYEQRGVTVTLAGREKVGDRDTFVLTLQPKAGSPVRQYIDAQSFLLVRSVSTVDVPQVGQLEQTTDFLDHRDVDGTKFPFQVKTASTVQTVSATITKVEHNNKIDEALFRKPAN